jgi:hypothetical protein
MKERDPVISLTDARHRRGIRKRADRLDRALSFIECAEQGREREGLFLAACAMKANLDDGIGTKRTAYFFLRGEAGLHLKLPWQEVNKIISAAFFRAPKRGRTK